MSTDLYLNVSAVGSAATPPLTVEVTVLDTEEKRSETLAEMLEPVCSTVLNRVFVPVDVDAAPPDSTSPAE